MIAPRPLAYVLNLYLPMLMALPGPAPGHAQEPGPPASQHGTVSQRVNRTTITLEYDRPVVRGQQVYGGVIDWDVVSTPGANRATWIEFSTPVTFAGMSVEAGRLGLLHVTLEAEPWEVILVRDWDTHHSFFPFGSEVISVRAPVETGEHYGDAGVLLPGCGTVRDRALAPLGDDRAAHTNRGPQIGVRAPSF